MSTTYPETESTSEMTDARAAFDRILSPDGVREFSPEPRAADMLGEGGSDVIIRESVLVGDGLLLGNDAILTVVAGEVIGGSAGTMASLPLL